MMKRNPSLASLIAYVTVMRHGTVTEASAQLNIAQPALSRLITKCEENLGVALFRRERRRLIPTETAERLLPEVERLLASHAELPDLAGDLSLGGRAMLRIAAAPRLCNGLVGKVVLRLTAMNPDVRYVVDSRERGEIERWLASHRYEIGVASLPIPSEGVDILPLGEADAVLILRKDDPLAQSDRVRISDIARRKMILTAPGSLLRERTVSVFAGTGRKIAPLLEVGTSPVAIHYVSLGLGLFIGDMFSAIGLPDDLTTRPMDISFSQRVGFIAPKDRPVSAVAAEFMDLSRKITAEAGIRLTDT